MTNFPGSFRPFTPQRDSHVPAHRSLSPYTSPYRSPSSTPSPNIYPHSPSPSPLTTRLLPPIDEILLALPLKPHKNTIHEFERTRTLEGNDTSLTISLADLLAIGEKSLVIGSYANYLYDMTTPFGDIDTLLLMPNTDPKCMDRFIRLLGQFVNTPSDLNKALESYIEKATQSKLTQFTYTLSYRQQLRITYEIYFDLLIRAHLFTLKSRHASSLYTTDELFIELDKMQTFYQDSPRTGFVPCIQRTDHYEPHIFVQFAFKLDGVSIDLTFRCSLNELGFGYHSRNSFGVHFNQSTRTVKAFTTPSAYLPKDILMEATQLKECYESKQLILPGARTTPLFFSPDNPLKHFKLVHRIFEALANGNSFFLPTESCIQLQWEILRLVLRWEYTQGTAEGSLSERLIGHWIKLWHSQKSTSSSILPTDLLALLFTILWAKHHHTNAVHSVALKEIQSACQHDKLLTEAICPKLAPECSSNLFDFLSLLYSKESIRLILTTYISVLPISDQAKELFCDAWSHYLEEYQIDRIDENHFSTTLKEFLDSEHQLQVVLQYHIKTPDSHAKRSVLVDLMNTWPYQKGQKNPLAHNFSNLRRTQEGKCLQLMWLMQQPLENFPTLLGEHHKNPISSLNDFAPFFEGLVEKIQEWIKDSTTLTTQRQRLLQQIAAACAARVVPELQTAIKELFVSTPQKTITPANQALYCIDFEKNNVQSLLALLHVAKMRDFAFAHLEALTPQNILAKCDQKVIEELPQKIESPRALQLWIQCAHVDSTLGLSCTFEKLGHLMREVEQDITTTLLHRWLLCMKISPKKAHLLVSIPQFWSLITEFPDLLSRQSEETQKELHTLAQRHNLTYPGNLESTLSLPCTLEQLSHFTKQIVEDKAKSLLHQWLLTEQASPKQASLLASLPGFWSLIKEFPALLSKQAIKTQKALLFHTPTDLRPVLIRCAVVEENILFMQEYLLPIIEQTPYDRLLPLIMKCHHQLKWRFEAWKALFQRTPDEDCATLYKMSKGMISRENALKRMINGAHGLKEALEGTFDGSDADQRCIENILINQPCRSNNLKGWLIFTEMTLPYFKRAPLFLDKLTEHYTFSELADEPIGTATLLLLLERWLASPLKSSEENFKRALSLLKTLPSSFIPNSEAVLQMANLFRIYKNEPSTWQQISFTQFEDIKSYLSLVLPLLVHHLPTVHRTEQGAMLMMQYLQHHIAFLLQALTSLQQKVTPEGTISRTALFDESLYANLKHLTEYYSHMLKMAQDDIPDKPPFLSLYSFLDKMRGCFGLLDVVFNLNVLTINCGRIVAMHALQAKNPLRQKNIGDNMQEIWSSGIHTIIQFKKKLITISAHLIPHQNPAEIWEGKHPTKEEKELRLIKIEIEKIETKLFSLLTSIIWPLLEKPRKLHSLREIFAFELAVTLPSDCLYNTYMECATNAWFLLLPRILTDKTVAEIVELSSTHEVPERFKNLSHTINPSLSFAIRLLAGITPPTSTFFLELMKRIAEMTLDAYQEHGSKALLDIIDILYNKVPQPNHLAIFTSLLESYVLCAQEKNFSIENHCQFFNTFLYGLLHSDMSQKEYQQVTLDTVDAHFLLMEQLYEILIRHNMADQELRTFIICWMCSIWQIQNGTPLDTRLFNISPLVFNDEARIQWLCYVYSYLPFAVKKTSDNDAVPLAEPLLIQLVKEIPENSAFYKRTTDQQQRMVVAQLNEILKKSPTLECIDLLIQKLNR